MKHYILLLLLLFLAGIAGCKKSIEVGTPETNPTGASLYTSDVLAASVVTYLYAKMAGAGPNGYVTSFAQGTSSINVYSGLAADELQPYASNTGIFRNLYRNNASVLVPGLWKELYQYIYVTNAVMEGIANSTGGMTDSVKKQLTGEAKFMRAFLHFYVTNLFGNVPFISTTDYEVNKTAPRMQKQEVYGRIVADLQEAKNLLSDNYLTPTGGVANDRVRPNKWTATALLARVYLYMNEWAKAESEASAVLSNTAKFNLVTDITKVFMKDSREVLWNIQPVTIGIATVEGNVFVLTVPPNANFPVFLRPAFANNNFEAGDKRRTSWIDSPTIAGTKYYCPGKYKVKTLPTNINPVPAANEYLVVFRLAEQYLIRAEARARQDKIGDAQNDLNEVRKRAGLGLTAANDQASLLSAIEHERQTELFCEWGHRWLDLKRTGRVDTVMPTVTPLKGGAWNTNMQLFPIPSNEISLNPNLAPQNPGYN